MESKSSEEVKEIMNSEKEIRKLKEEFLREMNNEIMMGEPCRIEMCKIKTPVNEVLLTEY